jgi:hypothetical protein
MTAVANANGSAANASVAICPLTAPAETEPPKQKKNNDDDTWNTDFAISRSIV